MLTLIRRFISDQSFAVQVIMALGTAAVAYIAVAATGGRPIDGALAASAALGFHGTAAGARSAPTFNLPSVQFTTPDPQTVHASSAEPSPVESSPSVLPATSPAAGPPVVAP